MGACAKPFIFSLVLLLLISHSQQQMEVSPAPSPACTERCKETKRPNLCKRACGSCCLKCNCVPPGTSSNYDACPCYFNLKTHNQIRKCP
ncbi:hypothetical protein DCAR_0414495 [Daucus carota subsp. sativus]|uniref:Uncharacterized protein n=1 Tax=Daucus carota subsp. sativus TaxID=79200 RepID=A0AAF1AU92_DAUCS|nr:hypothetical protein DCAR_0414495 [Daucus carota subsp. sativus]